MLALQARFCTPGAHVLDADGAAERDGEREARSQHLPAALALAAVDHDQVTVTRHVRNTPRGRAPTHGRTL